MAPQAQAGEKAPESIVIQDKVFSDYESQIIEIFQDLIDHPGSSNISGMPYPVFPTDKATALLKKYVEKMRNGEMHVKNVVFRTDIKNIRITWGDKNDDYLFKIAYGTSMDKVLRNSLYADKDKIPDIKLIYHEDGKLKYVWIYHKKVRQAPYEDPSENNLSAPRPENYVMFYNIARRCDFCHELAKYDGSKTGLFFQRYQYKSHLSGNGIEKTDGLFREEDFKLTKKSDSFIAKALGSRMPDQFYYRRVPIVEGGDQSPIYAIMLETPELLTVLAEDNGKSYCVSMIYTPQEVLTNENYFCADVEKKKLYVHFENPWPANKIPPGMPKEKSKPALVDYERDFWAEPAMPTAAAEHGHK